MGQISVLTSLRPLTRRVLILSSIAFPSQPSPSQILQSILKQDNRNISLTGVFEPDCHIRDLGLLVCDAVYVVSSMRTISLCN